MSRGPQNLRHVVAGAAAIAAPVFRQQGWTWACDGMGAGHVPSEGEIALAMRDLVTAASKEADGGLHECGRLAVVREPGKLRLFLSLGRLEEAKGAPTAASGRVWAQEQLEVLQRLGAARSAIDALLTGEWRGTAAQIRAVADLVGSAADHARRAAATAHHDQEPAGQ